MARAGKGNGGCEISFQHRIAHSRSWTGIATPTNSEFATAPHARAPGRWPIEEHVQCDARCVHPTHVTSHQRRLLAFSAYSGGWLFGQQTEKLVRRQVSFGFGFRAANATPPPGKVRPVLAAPANLTIVSSAGYASKSKRHKLTKQRQNVGCLFASGCRLACS